MTALALTPQQRSAVDQFEAQSPWLSLSVWDLMAHNIAQAAPQHELLRGSWAFKGLPPEQIDLYNQIGAAGSGFTPLDGFRATLSVRATSPDFN
ncbi:MAG: hypothetical protein KDA91_26250, partial [Planctomycetaceae bacterium]|nr:hypothetical protein [Planctomycetaceae bacterium]